MARYRASGRERPLLKALRGLRQKAPRPLLAVFFAGLICVSLFEIWQIHSSYLQEQQIRRQMEQFRPEAQPSADPALGITNQSVLDAQGLNPDIVGWLTLDGTRIDYPFVQAADNDAYLRRDINGEKARAGTLFLDCACDGAMQGFSSIIYGHNMKNGSMFADLKTYDDPTFWNRNQTGWLFLPHATYKIEVFAYLTVQSDDSMVYSTSFESGQVRQALLDYLQQSALRYRDLALTPRDRLLILSTCANDYGKARTIVAARLIQLQ